MRGVRGEGRDNTVAGLHVLGKFYFLGKNFLNFGRFFPG